MMAGVCVQSPAERGTRDSFVRVNPKNLGLSDRLKTMGHWSQLERAYTCFSSESPEVQALFLTLVLGEILDVWEESPKRSPKFTKCKRFP